MKKTQFNKLSLNKKTISSFTIQNIKGGTGVSNFIRCFEEFTEGCPAQTEGNCPSYTCATNNLPCQRTSLDC